jgi:GMP synthase-like glutamine amidotransferase
MSKKLKLAILDMNKGHKNLGLNCIKNIVEAYSDDIEYDVFDVRIDNIVPDLSYDLYISSGGPGNPLVGNGIWEHKYFAWLDTLWTYNQKNPTANRKHAFFICHSFQLVCNHFEVGDITPRRSTSFGVFPVHKTPDGKEDKILNKLSDPFYVIDSRDWQLIQPKLRVFREHGFKILALERIRSHVESERAIMAVRFSDEMMGTQFHPEADAEGMKFHLLKEENRKKIIENFSPRKYENMLALLDHPEKIEATQSVILPGFLENAIFQKTSHLPKSALNKSII